MFYSCLKPEYIILFGVFVYNSNNIYYVGVEIRSKDEAVKKSSSLGFRSTASTGMTVVLS